MENKHLFFPSPAAHEGFLWGVPTGVQPWVCCSSHRALAAPSIPLCLAPGAPSAAGLCACGTRDQGFS